MDIEKDFLEMQIAYEKNCAIRCNCSYEELKAQLDNTESLFGTRYLEGSPRHENWLLWVQAWQAAQIQAVPDGFVLVKNTHPDSIVHNQGLGLFKECQVIFGWDNKSKDFRDGLNKGFYHGIKLGARSVLETKSRTQEQSHDLPLQK